MSWAGQRHISGARDMPTLVRRRMKYAAFAAARAAAAIVLSWPVAQAAELSGVFMPESQDAGGAHLHLNGMALRTYSFLGIRIYVAGLYLPAPMTDPDQIIDGDSTKLLRFVFLRDVDASAARRSWREGLARSCQAPCHLPPSSVERFLAGIPAVHAGDTSTFLFTPEGLTISMDGKTMGQIGDKLFSRTILSTFIGPHPTAEAIKRDLLKGAA